MLGQPSKQRIFISYRRDDAQWAAGRLADALSAYFGDQRVFRDIDGIAGGADFGHVIQENLGTADAVIVLIGPDWLNAADSQGQQRLQNPTDWVVREVAAALEKGVPVYPVLVDRAAMPRSVELPEVLKPMARFNAMSISDDRWQADVSRLARIVALDIPSETGRHLHRINLLVSATLLLVLVFTVSVVVFNLLLESSQVSADGSSTPDGEPTWGFAQLFDSIMAEQASGPSRPGDCTRPPASWLVPLSTMQSGILFLVVVPASALLFVFGRYVDASRRSYVYGAAAVGALGSLVAFVLFYWVCLEYEPIVIFYVGMIVAPTMLALMGLSGFKSRN